MTVPFVKYDEVTGEITCTGYVPEKMLELQGDQVIVGEATVDTHYVDVKKKRLISKPTKPSQFHKWNTKKKRWDEDITTAYNNKKKEITQLIAWMSSEPIEFNGAWFDADEKSKAVISQWAASIASGQHVPTNFIWRDHDNIDHPCDDKFIIELHKAIIARDSLLKQQLWKAKEELAVLTTVDEITSFKFP